jgi:hypothetical protein
MNGNLLIPFAVPARAACLLQAGGRRGRVERSPEPVEGRERNQLVQSFLKM